MGKSRGKLGKRVSKEEVRGTGRKTPLSKTEEVEACSVREKGGFLQIRGRWKRMGGLVAEDVDKPMPVPATRQGIVHYRISGVKRWQPHRALLHQGSLTLYRGGHDLDDDSQAFASLTPVLSIKLGMSIVEFEKRKQKLDISSGGEKTHHLFFRCSAANFEDWLLSIYFHRAYSQLRNLYGSANHSAAPPDAAAARPPCGSYLGSAIGEVSAQFRRTKHAFLSFRSVYKPKTPLNWRIFRKKCAPVANAPEQQELDTLSKEMDVLAQLIEHLKQVQEQHDDKAQERIAAASSSPVLLVKTTSDIWELNANTAKELTSASLIPSDTASIDQPPSETDFDSEKGHDVEEEDGWFRSRTEEFPSPPPTKSQKDITPAPSAITKDAGPKKMPPPAKKEPEKSKPKEPAVKVDDKAANVVDKGPKGKRTQLPAKMPPPISLSISMAMKALTENSFPLNLFEPLGSLQRMAEPWEYAELVDAAMGEAEPVDRMGLVTGFAIAGLACCYQRVGKPFNPLLGESFALDAWSESGWRFYSEQVSHSPDVSVCCAEGRKDWRYVGVLNLPRPRLSFSYVSAHPTGRYQLSLLGNVRESYQYEPMECRVYNPTSPTKRQLYYVGNLEITCSNGLFASVKLDAGTTAVKGELRSGKGRGAKTLATLVGAWDELVELRPAGAKSGKVVFRFRRPPPDAAAYYGFGLFARSLNEPLPPNCSRFLICIHCTFMFDASLLA